MNKAIKYKRIKSKILNETYTEYQNYIEFDNDIIYNLQEISLLKNTKPEVIKNIHSIKKTFKGTLINDIKFEDQIIFN